MAYIVTTKRPAAGTRPEHATWVVLSRRAVATLDEARAMAHYQFTSHASIADRWTPYLDAIDALPESGGRVAHLDGTVIEVARANWNEVADKASVRNIERLETTIEAKRRRGQDVPQSFVDSLAAAKQDALDAFNAQEGD